MINFILLKSHQKSPVSKILQYQLDFHWLTWLMLSSQGASAMSWFSSLILKRSYSQSPLLNIISIFPGENSKCKVRDIHGSAAGRKSVRTPRRYRRGAYHMLGNNNNDNLTTGEAKNGDDCVCCTNVTRFGDKYGHSKIMRNEKKVFIRIYGFTCNLGLTVFYWIFNCFQF